MSSVCSETLIYFWCKRGVNDCDYESAVKTMREMKVFMDCGYVYAISENLTEIHGIYRNLWNSESWLARNRGEMGRSQRILYNPREFENLTESWRILENSASWDSSGIPNLADQFSVGLVACVIGCLQGLSRETWGIRMLLSRMCVWMNNWTEQGLHVAGGTLPIAPKPNEN